MMSTFVWMLHFSYMSTNKAKQDMQPLTTSEQVKVPGINVSQNHKSIFHLQEGATSLQIFISLCIRRCQIAQCFFVEVILGLFCNRRIPIAGILCHSHVGHIVNYLSRLCATSHALNVQA